MSQPADTAPEQAPPPARGWWPRLTRLLTWAFFGVVGYFIIRYAQGVRWDQVWASITGMPLPVLAGAAALSALSLTLYSCFDLLGRHYTGHALSTSRVMKINFISYAFNLNLGSLVGGVAFRFRMYSRSGLNYATITRIMTLSMITNWLGYLVLAGLIFTIAPLPLPPDWKLDSLELRWIGVLLLMVALGYIALCLWSPRRSFMVRGHELLLPPRRMVPMQLVMSCANWSIMGAIVWLLTRGEFPYPTVLAVLLVAAIAGVITHVPAGLGVLEAVFIALLSHRMPEWQLLGALLTYRALYYIAPLLVALLLYLWFEARHRPPARERYGSGG